jgi:hypothetical protein
LAGAELAELGRSLLVAMPTDPKALVDLLLVSLEALQPSAEANKRPIGGVRPVAHNAAVASRGRQVREAGANQ